MRKKAAVKFALARLREPSSWASIAVLLAALGLPSAWIEAAGAALDVAPHLIDLGALLVAVVAGVVLKERGEA